MSPFILLEAADVTVGPADKASLSQQALMELVIQEITNKQVTCRDKDKPEKIEAWDGVTTDDGKVRHIDWHGKGLHGPVHLEWLPLTVIKFGAGENRLTGTIDLSDLPPAMLYLYLRKNDFVGPVDLRRLPAELGYLRLCHNSLNGSADLTRLPGKLKYLYLENNRFSGSLNLTNLPPKIEDLYLQLNFFSGTVDGSRLPRSLTTLALDGNELSGEFFVDAALLHNISVRDTKLIKRMLEFEPLNEKRRWQTSLMDQFYESIVEMGKIEISEGNPSHDYCAWGGVICDAGIINSVKYWGYGYGNFDVHSLPPEVEAISICVCVQKYAIDTRKFPRELRCGDFVTNALYGSVDLRTLPIKLVRLNFSRNNLIGPIELTSLPPTLERLDLQSNNIVQSVVYYDQLPPKAYEIRLVAEHRTNHIMKVCAVHAKMAVKNKAIFKGMSKKEVQ